MSKTSSAHVESVSHIGLTVKSLAADLPFFEWLLGRKPRSVGLYADPYIAAVTNIPGAALDVAYFDLPGGSSLELTEYKNVSRQTVPDTASPGSAHLSLQVNGIEDMWNVAPTLGARPVSSGIVKITSGPNRGASIAYLRSPGDAVVELFEPLVGAEGAGSHDRTP